MTSIFVAKLDFGVTNEQLKALFEQHGKVNKASVAIDRETGKSRGFGFVEMPDLNEAQQAIRALDGFHVNGRPIAVKQAEDRSGSKGPQSNQKPGFNSSNQVNNTKREEYNRPKSDYTPPPAPVTPDVFSLDSFKTDQRKKGKEKTKAELDAEIKAKKIKLDAQNKKANKYNKFYEDDDEDLDPELFSYRKKDEEDLFDDEEDDDDF
jgi:RNA recognition motif-containing protein